MAETVKVKKTGKNGYAAPAVDGMLDILEFMSSRSGPFGVSELARSLGISNNLVFRVMKRLVERGYAEMEPETGAYHLGVKFYSLGMALASRFELRRRGRKHLEHLTGETGETCQVQVLDGHNMLVLDSVSPASDFFLQVVPGSRMYCHCNAFGKAVLAFKPEEFVREVISGELPKMTEHTISDYEKFRDELVEVRRIGLAFDREEYAAGVYCIVAPVFDVENNVVAGCGITGLASRFCPDLTAKLGRMVLDCAARISGDIGYNGNFYLEKQDSLK